MKRLRLRTQDEYDGYADDVERIIRICADRGYAIDYATAKAAWQAYSDSMAAGWMRLDEEDDYVYANIYVHLVEDENDV